MSLDAVICPGCGRKSVLRGGPAPARESSCEACERCGYENGLAPFRLLTLGEMLALPASDGAGAYQDVDMGPFLRAVRAELEGSER